MPDIDHRQRVKAREWEDDEVDLIALNSGMTKDIQL